MFLFIRIENSQSEDLHDQEEDNGVAEPICPPSHFT